MEKTLVLTSKQNFSWQSMQEIIPFLVESWKATDPENVEVIDVDQVPMRVYLKTMIQSENVILTCFTPGLYKVAAFIRNEINPSARFIVHLHNQSTIACWPLRYWGSEKFFRKSDVFVSSCARDAQCLLKTYPEAQTKVVPFSYQSLGEKLNPAPDLKTVPFVYIGRLSSQKNLHTLFLSLSHLHNLKPDLNWTLDLFGKEDGLGSPNMGFQDSGYESFLKNLAGDLKIKDRIHFRGFQARSVIQEWLEDKKSIFVAPSLHSDENFGMAAFQSLIKGHMALLSDWGGHADYIEYFPKQVLLTPVYNSPFGPFVHPMQLANTLLEASDKYKLDTSGPMPDFYKFDSIVVANRKILSQESTNNEVLIASEIADSILKEVSEKISAQPQKQDQKIFDSYQDPKAHIFLEAYGMKHKISADLNWKHHAPWLIVQDQKAIIKDPHRGHFMMEPFSSEAIQRKLQESGYLYL